MGSSALDRFFRSRDWLALRLIAISLPANAVLWWMMDFVDRDDLFGEFPKWLQYVVILPVVAGFFGLGYLLLRGSQDLLVHVLPAGRFKHAVVGDDAAIEQSLKEFPELGRVAAFAPLWLVGFYLGLLLIAGFALGGFAALSGIWRAVSGWPSWAVFTTILLVMILFKRRVGKAPAQGSDDPPPRKLRELPSIPSPGGVRDRSPVAQEPGYPSWGIVPQPRGLPGP